MLKILLVLLLMTSPAWAINQWREGTGAQTIRGAASASDIDFYSFNDIVNPLDNLLSNYRKGMSLLYNSASQLDISTGEITVSNADGSIRLMLHNTTNTTISFSDLDTGAEASATTYYIYAIAASSSATSATFKISASSTSPSGFTYYKKIGSFYNNSSSDIDQGKIYTEPYGFAMTDSSGFVSGAIGAVYDYGTSSSTSTRRNLSSYYIAHGVTTDGTAITNLPYTSTTSYECSCLMQAAGGISQNVQITSKTATSFTCSDGLGNGNSIDWKCFGY